MRLSAHGGCHSLMGYVVFYLIVAFAATVPDDWSDRQTEAKGTP
jgi:hypothetical protein